MSYIPRQRDIVWIDFDPAKGYEIKKEDQQLSLVVLNIILQLSIVLSVLLQTAHIEITLPTIL